MFGEQQDTETLGADETLGAATSITPPYLPPFLPPPTPHEDQTSVFTASDNDEDGTHIDTIQMADRTTILLRRGTTRTNTWYTHNSIFSHS